MADVEMNGLKKKSLSSKSVDVADETTEASGRPLWSNQIEFLMTMLGLSIGLGNVWRFPYLCYKNGGGAFLIPYLIALVCAGAPVLILEVALGQYTSQGGIGAWAVCPIFKGIGITTSIIVSLLNVYYPVVLAWDVYYCYMAFTSVLPWTHCNNSWNTDSCRADFNSSFGETMAGNNTTVTYSYISDNTSQPLNITRVDPVTEFWERKVLQISSGIDEPDGVVGHLALSLLFVWVVSYFCLWKGIRWTGKVVYFTATFPYVILTILLVRGVTLDGAADGIVYYLKPDFTKLASSQVWIDAGTQVFFSYSVALGAMTALGSYNKFHTNLYRNCIIFSVINSSTSFYSGFVIFSILGFMAKEHGVDVSLVADSGPGLVFIAYPKAAAMLPYAPVWAILFFIMIFILGLDSQFVDVEAFLTVGTDMFPLLRKRKEVFVAVYCIVTYLLGLTLVTRGGMYVFQLFDYYAASGMALLWGCFFQCAAVAWIYGVGRFYDNIEQMLGFRINLWLKICWTVITPVLTAGMFLFMWAKYETLKYNRNYVYPKWAIGMGICMALASMACIPIYFAVTLLRTPGTFRKRWKKVTTPVLLPQRVPSHWPDAEHLRAVGHQHLSKRRSLYI